MTERGKVAECRSLTAAARGNIWRIMARVVVLPYALSFTREHRGGFKRPSLCDSAVILSAQFPPHIQRKYLAIYNLINIYILILFGNKRSG